MAQLAAVNDDTARLSVLDAIGGITGPFTVNDIVTRTGLAPYQAESVLNDVIREYDADLDVDEDGNLIYRFDKGLTGREDIVKADAKRRRKEAWRQRFVSFFKAWTIAMIVVFFVIYVALLIAALAAMSQNRREGSSSSSRRGFGGGGGWWIFWGSSHWGYGGYGSWASRRRRRRRARDIDRRLDKGEDPYDLRKGVDTSKKPPMLERVWFHLFGTDGIKKNPLEQEKELLTYIRAKKGFVSNADIVALLGVTYDDADRIGTRLVATYDGEMDLTDDGIAIYRFPNLSISMAKEVEEQAASLGYLWQVRAQEKHLRDNPAVAIPILNVVNIFLAFAVWFYAMPVLGIHGIGALIALVWFPMLFSVIFFAVGMRRKLRDAANKKQYERDNMRISIFKLLFTRRTAVKIPGDEREIAAAGLGSWGQRELTAAAAEIAEQLRGEVVPHGGGVAIRSERVWKEMAAVDRLRRDADRTRPVGRTVFSTRAGAGAVEPGAPAATGDDLSAAIEALEAEMTEDA